jgi:hypothetical protein
MYSARTPPRWRADYAAWTEWETVQDEMSLDWRISPHLQFV